MARLLRRIRYWIRRREVEAALAEELETHRALEQERLEQSGVPVAEARYASHRALGNAVLAREDARVCLDLAVARERSAGRWLRAARAAPESRFSPPPSSL